MSIFTMNTRKHTVQEGINRSRTEKNAALIDVRGREDFKAKHVSGAINVPLDQLESIETRVRDKDTMLYLIGSYTNKPQKAVRRLKKLGYHNLLVCGYMEEHVGIMVHG